MAETLRGLPFLLQRTPFRGTQRHGRLPCLCPRLLRASKFMPNTTLVNPIKSLDATTRININLDSAAFDYFFRGVFAGERGAAAALTNILYGKLHAACLERGISPSWDPDSANVEQLRVLLDELNFLPRTGCPNPTSSKRKQKQKAAGNVT